MHGSWLILALAGALGCGPTLPPAPPSPPASPESYVLRSGDLVDVRFYKTPELNLDRVPVRPDGRISVELIGDVAAAGRTPTEFAAALRDAYAAELDDPRITVIVREFGGSVYVEGQVRGGGALTQTGIRYVEGMTALQAISLAGGFQDTAGRDSVILIRRETQGLRGYRLDLAKAMSGEDLQQDARLAPSDIVVVPRSTVADVNLFVLQYIRNNLPVDPSLAAAAAS